MKDAPNMRHLINLAEWADRGGEPPSFPKQNHLDDAAALAESFYDSPVDDGHVYSFSQFLDDVAAQSDPNLYDDTVGRSSTLSGLSNEQLRLIWRYGEAVGWIDLTVAHFTRWLRQSY